MKKLYRSGHFCQMMQLSPPKVTGSKNDDKFSEISARS
ncbi:hypothetical protein O53_4242 [Microcystis aeruginosa TAIHU98]|uniref:Uncharacterized protein n=1 Tax=Microcystis aeruginosa TAIHU98 TaxID=1134457 RepID=L7E2I8_MICAE|nr:hypothetical protein O53_4242 [Microcystis aeruginosa TAIHU98]